MSSNPDDIMSAEAQQQQLSSAERATEPADASSSSGGMSNEASRTDEGASLAPKSLVHIPEVTGVVPPAPGETPQQAALRILTTWHDAASEELKHLISGGKYLNYKHGPVPLAPLPPSATLPNPGTQTGMTVATIVRFAAQRPPGVTAQQAIAQAARELNAATPGLIPNLEQAVRNLDAQAAAQARAMAGMGASGTAGAVGTGAAGVAASAVPDGRGVARATGASTRSSHAAGAHAPLVSVSGTTLPNITLPTQSNPRAPRPISAFAMTGVEQAVRRHLGDNALKLLGHSPQDVVTLALRSPEEIAQAMEELANRKLELSSAIRRFQLESGRNLTRAAEPPRNKTHWDFLLGEMEWLATDYQRERKWKMQLARKLSKAVMVYHERRATLAMRAEREAELHRKRLAAHVSRMVKQFWIYISKLVHHKHELVSQKARKIVLDDQLEKIVRTADRFSASIAMDLKQGAGSAARLQQQLEQQVHQPQQPQSASTGAQEKGRKSSKQAAATSTSSATHKPAVTSARASSRRGASAGPAGSSASGQSDTGDTDDADYVAHSSSEDDLDTLLQAEQEMDSSDERDEIAKLSSETDKPIDEILDELTKMGYEPSPWILARRRLEAERARKRNAELREERAARAAARRISAVQQSVSKLATSSEQTTQEVESPVESNEKMIKQAAKLDTESTSSLMGFSMRSKRASSRAAMQSLTNSSFGDGQPQLPPRTKRVRLEDDAAIRAQLEKEAEEASEYEAEEEEEDDEETLEADEKAEIEAAGGSEAALAVAREQELLELEREKDMPLEELLRRYYPHRLKTDTTTGTPVVPYAFGKRPRPPVLQAPGLSRVQEDSEGRHGEDASETGAGTEGDLEEEEGTEESPTEADQASDEESLRSDDEDDEGDTVLSEEDEDEEEDEEEEPAAPAPHTAEDEAKLDDSVRTASAFQPVGNTYETQSVRTPIPPLLRATLREYQHIGLDWLVSLYENKLNGILADEMGLGKTIMTIAWLAWLAYYKGVWGQHLIIVPTSVMVNWEMEFKRFCPSFKILCYHGSAKQRLLKRRGWTDPNAFHVCITSYQLALQDARIFKRKKWHCLVLDEAHNIKNFKSRRWQCMLNLRTERRLLLTGTPLQNNLMELWALMHFLMPHIFQSHSEFRDWFSAPLTSMIEGKEAVNQALIQRLHGVLRPFLLRRLKKDVAKQLPAKYEHIIKCRLSKRQRQLYEEYVSRADTQRTLQCGSFLGMMSVLLQLRKVCSHPDLFESRPIISSLEAPCVSVAGVDRPWLHGSVVRLLEQNASSPLRTNALKASLLASATGVRWQRHPFEVAPNFAPALLGAKLLSDHPLPPYYRPLEASTNAYTFQEPPPLAERPQGFGGSLVYLPNRDAPFLGVTPMTPSQSLTLPWSTYRIDSTSDWALPVIHPNSWLATCIDMGWDPRPPTLNLISERRYDKTPSVPLSAIDDGPLDVTSPAVRSAKQQGKDVEDLTEPEAGSFGNFWKDINEARNRVIEETRRRNEQINKLRTELAPTSVYPTSLARLLAVEHPVAMARARLQNVRHPEHHNTPRILAEMIKLPAERAVEMEDVITTYTCLIPKARVTKTEEGFNPANAAIAPTLTPQQTAAATGTNTLMCMGGQLPVRHDDMSAHDRELERVSALRHTISSMQDIFHKRAVRSMVHFPDKRLLQWDCGKLQALARLLVKLKAEGHRVLIFTQFSQMLDILEAFLNFHGHTYLRLDGATRTEERAKLMERFNTSNKYFCFILSTRAGGVGINLTGADTVVFFDSDWNPAIDQQAQDRCHRIGQTREVHIYRLVTENSVEENILKKSQQKQHMNAVVIGDGQFTTEYLDRLDPRELLGLKAIPDMETQAPQAPAPADLPQGAPTDVRQLTALLETLEDEADREAARRLRAENNEDAMEFSEAGPTPTAQSASPYAVSPSDPDIAEKFAAIERKLTPIQRLAFHFAENYAKYVIVGPPKRAQAGTGAVSSSHSITEMDSLALPATIGVADGAVMGTGDLAGAVKSEATATDSITPLAGAMAPLNPTNTSSMGNGQGDQTHPSMSDTVHSAKPAQPMGAVTGVVSSVGTSPSATTSAVGAVKTEFTGVAGVYKAFEKDLLPIPKIKDAELPELPQPQVDDTVKFDLRAKIQSFADINAQTKALFAAFPPISPKQSSAQASDNPKLYYAGQNPDKLVPPASYLNPSLTYSDLDAIKLKQLQALAKERPLGVSIDPATGRPLDPMTSFLAPLPSSDPASALSNSELSVWSPYHSDAYTYPSVTALPSAPPSTVVPSTWHAHMLHKSRYATARLALQQLQVRRLIYDSRVIRPPALPGFEDDYIFPLETLFDYSDPDRNYGTFSSPYSVARMLPRTRADPSLRGMRIRSLAQAGYYSLPRASLIIVNEEQGTLRIPTWHLRSPAGLVGQHNMHAALTRQKQLRQSWPSLCRPPAVTQALAQGKIFAPLPALGKAPEGSTLLNSQNLIASMQDEAMTDGGSTSSQPGGAQPTAKARAVAAAVAAAAAATAAIAAGSAARGNLAAWSALAQTECELNPYPLPNNISVYCHPYTSRADSQLHVDGSHIPNRVLNLLPSPMPFGGLSHHPWSPLGYDGSSSFGTVSPHSTTASANTMIPAANSIILPIDPANLNDHAAVPAGFSTCPTYVPPAVQKIRAGLAYAAATAPAPGAMHLGRDPNADSLQAARIQPWLKRAALASAATQFAASFSLADPIVTSRASGATEYATWTPSIAIRNNIEGSKAKARRRSIGDRRAGLSGAIAMPVGTKRKFDELYAKAVKEAVKEAQARSKPADEGSPADMLDMDRESASSMANSSDSEPLDEAQVLGQASEPESDSDDEIHDPTKGGVRFYNPRGGSATYTMATNPYKFKRYRPSLDWQLENPRKAWPSAPLSALLFKLPSARRSALPLVPQTPPAPLPLSSPLAALHYSALYALHEQKLAQAMEMRKLKAELKKEESSSGDALIAFDQSGERKTNHTSARRAIVERRQREAKWLQQILLSDSLHNAVNVSTISYSALDRAARILGLETTPSLRGHFSRAPNAPGQGLFVGNPLINRREPMPTFVSRVDLPNNMDVMLRKSDAMWRSEEDELLTHLVSIYGTNWTLISDLLTMHPVARQRLKTARQCCIRFSVLMQPYRAHEPYPAYILTFASAAAEHMPAPVFPMPPRATPLAHLAPPLTLFAFLPAVQQQCIVNAFTHILQQQQSQQQGQQTQSQQSQAASAQGAQGGTTQQGGSTSAQGQSIANLQVSTQAASWANTNQAGSSSPNTGSNSAQDRKKRKGSLAEQVGQTPSTPTAMAPPALQSMSSAAASAQQQSASAVKQANLKRVKTGTTPSTLTPSPSNAGGAGTTAAGTAAPGGSGASAQPAGGSASGTMAQGTQQPGALPGQTQSGAPQQGQGQLPSTATFGTNTPLGLAGLGHTTQQAIAAGLLDSQGQPTPKLLGRGGIGSAPRPFVTDSNPALPPYYSFIWMDHAMRRLTEQRRAARLALPVAPTVVEATATGAMSEEQARAQACKAIAASPHESQIIAQNQAYRTLGITPELLGNERVNPLLLVQQRLQARRAAALNLVSAGPRVVTVQGTSQGAGQTVPSQPISREQTTAAGQDMTSQPAAATTEAQPTSEHYYNPSSHTAHTAPQAQPAQQVPPQQPAPQQHMMPQPHIQHGQYPMPSQPMQQPAQPQHAAQSYAQPNTQGQHPHVQAQAQQAQYYQAQAQAQAQMRQAASSAVTQAMQPQARSGVQPGMTASMAAGYTGYMQPTSQAAQVASSDATNVTSQPMAGQSHVTTDGSTATSSASTSSTQNAVVASLGLHVVRAHDGTYHYAYRNLSTGAMMYAPYDQNSLSMIYQYAQHAVSHGATAAPSTAGGDHSVGQTHPEMYQQQPQGQSSTHPPSASNSKE